MIQCAGHAVERLRASVEDAVALASANAFSKGLELIADIDPDVPRQAVGDPWRVRQILSNFLSNAVKFTSRGEIVISLAVLSPPRDAEAHGAGRCVLRFGVRDTGIGISPEARHRLFKAFSQADDSTTRRFGGTGLGLAICSQLVALMGGEIGVESTSVEGSEFWFTVPLDARPNDSTESELPRSWKVLVAVENATARSILAEQIGRFGAEAAAAESPAQALDALLGAADGGRPFTLALVDLRLPPAAAAELVQRIRSDARIAATRLVGLATPNAAVAGDPDVHAPFDRLLTKPVTPIRLQQTLEAMHGGADDQPSTATAAVDAPAVELEELTGKVLIAEDNPVNLAVASRMIASLGLDVHVARDGIQAVEISARDRFDLILMDCQMPGLDGLSATARIRQREAIDGGHTPIIAVTANALDGDRESCLAAGMDDYISKPYSRATISSVIRRWIRRRFLETA